MRFRSIIAFLVSLFIVMPCLNAQPIKHIRISSEPDYPPYCFVDKDGKAAGFSIDLFLEAAKAMDIKVDVKVGIWSQIKEDLVKGKIDALPLVGITPERKDVYDFTFPYLTLHGAVFVRKGTTGIKSAQDLKNKTLIIMKGDNAYEYVRRENISNKIITVNTFKDAFRILANGQFDAVICQRVMGLQLLKQLEIESVEPLDIELSGFRQDFCFAVQKGNKELLSLLNEGLSVIIANGVYDKLHLKWFGPEYQSQISFKEILKISLYILIPLIIGFSFLSIILLRRQVKKRTKELVELNASKDKFFSIIAHDLKSPFMGLLGSTKILSEEPKQFTEEELMILSSEIHKTADNLFTLLNNLLDWALMQKGDMTFESVDFALTKLIEESLAIIKKRSDQKNISVNYLSQGSFIAQGDRNMIRSILLNLLYNAVKFTPRNGNVTIDVRQAEKHMLEISVCDTGVGMPETKVQKLFKTGEKVRTRGTDDETGTGLGLLLCKEFVEKNGGSIWAKSELEHGSIFYFTIPGYLKKD